MTIMLTNKLGRDAGYRQESMNVMIVADHVMAGGEDGGGGVHGQGDYREGLDDVCTEDVGMD